MPQSHSYIYLRIICDDEEMFVTFSFLRRVQVYSSFLTNNCCLLIMEFNVLLIFKQEIFFIGEGEAIEITGL